MTPHFKEAGHKVLHVDFPRKEDDTPDFDVFKAQADRITKEARAGKVAAAYVVEAGGIAAAITKMALGDRIGVELNDDVKDLLFAPHSGSWIIETDEATAAAWAKEEYVTVLGTLTKEPAIKVAGTELALADLEAAYESTLAPIFPLTAKSGQGEAVAYIHDQKAKPRQAPAIAKPRVVIPVFPGTNCEYDSA